MLDVFRPCVLPKGDISMPRPMSFDRVCCPKVMFACHVGVVRPFVLPKEDDGMPRPTSSDHVFCPKAMMACHALHRPTVSANPKAIMYATPDVVQPCLPV